MKALILALAMALCPPAHAQFRIASAADWQALHDSYFAGTAPGHSAATDYFTAHQSFYCSAATQMPCALATTMDMPEACAGRGRSRASRYGDGVVRVSAALSGSRLTLQTTDYGSRSVLSFTGSAWQGSTSHSAIPLPGERTTIRFGTNGHFYVRSYAGFLGIETYADCRPR